MTENEEAAAPRRLNLPLVLALIVLAGLGGLVFGAWWQAQSPVPEEPPQSLAVSIPIAPAPEPLASEPPKTEPPLPPAAAAPKSSETGQPRPPEPAARPQAALSPPPVPQPAPQQHVAATPRLPQLQGGPLRPVPDPALVSPGPFGPLPVIAPDGRQPWQVYARPFDSADSRPRIAVLIGDLGFSVSATNAAIDRLPDGVTLAFAPYADDLQNWIGKARLNGHEVMLQLPMEPLDYPTNDPGPRALLTSLAAADNIKRLEWMLGRFTGYVGVTNYMGSKFTTSASDMRPVLEALRSRGLLFVDSRSSQRSVASGLAKDLRMPFAVNSRFIDNEASRISIDARLEELERIARESGSALGIGYPYPVTIERVANWAAALEKKGLVLAPVSAVVQQQ